ncbi:MAG: M48 family metallopeptidase [Bacteroidetes bacterium]|nr:M48 family metallopeptidase [Bacteroidota bacterium]MBM3455661.1 M48 family metallopeptidase [Bacteroidota bacterium]
MSQYVGLQQQINRNNTRSVLLVIAFPALILGAFYAIVAFGARNGNGTFDADLASKAFISGLPMVIFAVSIWFLIAFLSHSAMINLATGAHTLERKNHMRVYNLTENLCMGVGMKMPKLQIIESDALNAFASGINEKTYTVTLTRGIIDKLNDQELEGVIAHELMHIRNRDVRLLIVSIIFVGIFSFLIQVTFRSLLYGAMSGGNRRRDGKDSGAALMVIILIVSIVAYILSLLFKFALSRKREYMADAGAAQMTKNPLALASALRKISGNAEVEAVKSEDIQEMFIENPPGSSAGFLGEMGALFSTHPPIEKRIKVLEQF